MLGQPAPGDIGSFQSSNGTRSADGRRSRKHTVTGEAVVFSRLNGGPNLFSIGEHVYDTIDAVIHTPCWRGFVEIDAETVLNLLKRRSGSVRRAVGPTSRISTST